MYPQDEFETMKPKSLYCAEKIRAKDENIISGEEVSDYKTDPLWIEKTTKLRDHLIKKY